LAWRCADPVPTRPPILRQPFATSPTDRERDRGSAASRGYGRRWQKLRAAFLIQHPQCAACHDPANEVDHIIPHRGNQAKLYDWDNLQSLCKPCHSKKTARGQ
jgi:5-methylcytosine-specific restriction protein A